MLSYNIAGISVEITSVNLNSIDMFSPFISHIEANADIKVSINCCDDIFIPKEGLLINEGFPWLHKNADCSTSVYVYAADSNQIAYMLDVNKNWDNASILYSKETTDIEYAVTGALGEILFRNHILFHQGIVIHSSAIEWDGKGILFSAPSETGKSTQARLWEKHMGAKILNGDRPAVRVIENQPYIFGTPWSGSSCEFVNNSAPLVGIVMLEQAKESSIKRLSNQEAVSRLMPRAFLPYYNSNLMELAITNIEKVITSTPVYLLKCTPDRTAVELVYKYIK